MRKCFFPIAVVALAVAAGPASWAAESALSRFERQSEQKEIRQRYQAEMTRCEPMRGNDLNVCRAAADARREVAEAQLALRAENTGENLRQLARVQAKAQYRLETALCDSRHGEAREACRRAAYMNLARYMALIKKDEEMESSSAVGK